ncbi:MAG: TldD/PmbA family protein [Tissierellales bacterium]|jgi:TldD protein|nr:TldD/PmbA family protein [Tissierellales bacterium]
MINKKIIENVIEAALSTGGDFAEIFIEDKKGIGINMISGKTENIMSGRDYGIGIRIFKDFNSVYAYTNKSDESTLIQTAKKASKALLGENIISRSLINNMKIEQNHKIEIKPSEIPTKKKIEAMRRAYESAKGFDDIISQVTVNYQDYNQKIAVANSEGIYVEDERTRTRLAIGAVATKDGEMQSGSSSPGAQQGFEFIENLDLEWHGKEAARIAKTMVEADYSPSGKMPVIIHNGFGGVIFHEACGHGLEATSVAKNNSVFAEKIGEKVASDIVTAVDDGTIPNEWGSSNIDDEGNPTQKNILIENGILKGYMIDKLNGRRMNMEPTGSSRRQSYKYPPTSRMTNTFIASGKSNFDEIISSTEKGLFAKYMGGGSVNPATGEFNFAVMEGYLVENGKIIKPVRGATLIGKGINILKKIDMVGDNLSFGQGMCGSSSGSVPANVGQPTIRVSEITVGGRE